MPFGYRGVSGGALSHFSGERSFSLAYACPVISGGPGKTRTSNVTRNLIYSQGQYQLCSTDPWWTRGISTPQPLGLQPSALPKMSYKSVWWAQQGLNLRLSACRADALPTELCAHSKLCFQRTISWRSGGDSNSRNGNPLYWVPASCHSH